MVYAERQPAAENDPALEAIRQIRGHSPHGSYATLEQANAAVVQRMIDSEPWLVDVVLAGEAMPQLAKGKRLLHAGPPLTWSEMTNPMRGAVLGAAMFEGWAADDATAQRLAESGEIEFMP